MIDASYIVGLTDGEGCFYVNLTERDNENFTLESVSIIRQLKLSMHH